ncbi:MAG: L-lactate dehydrogenase [Clostridia bacterium]|nr:L-lactate dehydrogenase [Clostridia bacterium]
MINIRKCAVIGCGFVGATTAFSLALSRLFSEMVLIDIDHKKAEGEAADISHALPFVSPMDIYAGNYADVSDANIIIITAGGPQRPGQTRTDLVKSNAKIFQSIVRNISIYNTKGIIIVVSNPVDVLSYLTLKISDFPASRVIGSGTVLDTSRLKYLVGRHLGVDPRNVHSFIIGEHGDSELPVWSSANVSGVDLNKFCESCNRGCNMASLHELFDDVKMSAYKIIEAKGATYYAIAEAVRKIVSAIMRDENTILPVSTLVDGHYGIENICLGLPCIVGASGIKQVLEIPLNDEELSLLVKSANKLRQIVNSLNMI